MKVSEKEKLHAIKLFSEVYGHIYKGIETILEECPVSLFSLNTWIERATFLVSKSKELALACEHKLATRAYKRAIELKGELEKERAKKWKTCLNEH